MLALCRRSAVVIQAMASSSTRVAATASPTSVGLRAMGVEGPAVCRMSSLMAGGMARAGTLQVRCISSSPVVLGSPPKPRQSTIHVYDGLRKRDSKRKKIRNFRRRFNKKLALADAPRPPKESVVGIDSTLEDDFKAVVATLEHGKQGSFLNMKSFMEKVKSVADDDSMVDNLMLVVELFKLYHKNNSRAMYMSFELFFETAMEYDVPELLCEMTASRQTYGVWPISSQYDRLIRSLLEQEDTELAMDMLNLAAEDPAVVVDPTLVINHFITLQQQLNTDEEVEMTDARVKGLMELCSWTLYAWGQQLDPEAGMVVMKEVVAQDALSPDDAAHDDSKSVRENTSDGAGAKTLNKSVDDASEEQPDGSAVDSNSTKRSRLPDSHPDSIKPKDHKFTRIVETTEIDSIIECVKTLNNDEITKHLITAFKKFVREENRAHLDTLLPLVCASNETEEAEASG